MTRKTTTTGTILVLLTALAAPCRADDYTIRDANGRINGRVERGVGREMVRRDAQGNRLGTVEPGPGEGRVLRDADGRRVGRVEPGR